MKRFFLFSLGLALLAFNLTAQKIAGFESGTSDLFNKFTWIGTTGSFGIVDNPSKTGINTTAKCALNFRVKGATSAWTESADFSSDPLNPVAVTPTNRYLHVFVYSDQSYAGYIRVRYTTADNKWLDPSKEIRFNFSAGKWTDVVLDLQTAGVTSIYGLYFMSQDWGNTYATNSNFYYDEIEISNDPNPRGVSVLETACTVADSETTGVSPQFTMVGTSGGSVLQLADNTLRTGANETLKALKVKQSNETVWWCRANITFNNPVKVNSNTRYLHVLVKSPLSGISVLTYEPAEHWFTQAVSKRNEWSDVVVDLMSAGHNLTNTVLNSIGICGNSSTFIPNMEWYIDQIAFSADPQPRTGSATFLDNISCEMTTEDTDWSFVNTNPLNTIKITNNNNSAATFGLNIFVRSAAKDSVELTQTPLTLAAGESKTISHELTNPVPGFYRYYLDVTDGTILRNKIVRQIGYNPDQMTSVNDAQPDFDAFWDAAKSELASVAPEYKVTYKQTYGSHLIYDVEMKSIKGKTIKGYLSVPNKTGKFPTIVLSHGFGVTASIPDRTDDYVVFTYNIRGMGISTDYSPVDDLFVNGLTDKNTYYYRECYMDALRAVDFVCTRPEVDTNKIFAEGESQGGALTFAIAALDSRILAIAPRLPFLSDFPLYYRIKENVNDIDEWPMSVLNQFMAKYSFSSTNTFKNLSYFDIKNLASKIKCPVLMCVGLQDPTCPPSINFAAYNQVTQPKEYMILKNNGHYSDATFITYKDAWFQKILDNIKSDTKDLKNDTFKKKIQTYISGNELNIYSATGTSLKISIYQSDGSLKSQKTMQNTTSIRLNPGVFILLASDSQNKMVRKIIVW